MTDFPNYDSYHSADSNYTNLRIYWSTHDSELYTHLLDEYNRLSKPISKNRIKLLFSHFRAEALRKQALEETGQLYIYKPIPNEKLLSLPTTEGAIQAQAMKLAASDARDRLMNQVHEIDMQELAAMTRQLELSGSITREEGDVILRKVTEQCGPAKKENVELQRQVINDDLINSDLKRRVRVLETELGVAEDEVIELRRELEVGRATLQEVDLLREVNSNLLQRPDQQQVLDLTDRLIMTLNQLHEREADVTTLERQLQTYQKNLSVLQESDALKEGREHLIEFQTRVIEKQDEQLQALEERLEEEKLLTLDLRRRTQDTLTPQDVREQMADLKRSYVKLYEDSVDAEFEYTSLLEDRAREATEELERLRDLPVFSTGPGGKRIETERTLGQLIDHDEEFYIVSGGEEEEEQNETVQGRLINATELALRDMLIKASKFQHGAYRVKLVIDSGVNILELFAEALAPQKIAAFREKELIIDFSQSDKIRYVRNGALQRNAIGNSGSIEITLYKAENQLGPSRLYKYSLSGTNVLKFPDGTLLYCSFLSISLYRLDALILPLDEHQY